MWIYFCYYIQADMYGRIGKQPRSIPESLDDSGADLTVHGILTVANIALVQQIFLQSFFANPILMAPTLIFTPGCTGQYTMFSNIVRKYGLVPKVCLATGHTGIVFRKTHSYTSCTEYLSISLGNNYFLKR